MVVGAASVDRGAAAGRGRDSIGLAEMGAITALPSHRPVRSVADQALCLASVIVSGGDDSAPRFDSLSRIIVIRPQATRRSASSPPTTTASANSVRVMRQRLRVPTLTPKCSAISWSVAPRWQRWRA